MKRLGWPVALPRLSSLPSLSTITEAVGEPPFGGLSTDGGL
ncbi:MAG: hypothetical protein ACRDZO_12915 [Egibacteraceae bacterium]